MDSVHIIATVALGTIWLRLGSVFVVLQADVRYAAVLQHLTTKIGNRHERAVTTAVSNGNQVGVFIENERQGTSKVLD